MWSIDHGPQTDGSSNGRDAVTYVWTIARDGDGAQRTVRVVVSRTALGSDRLPSPLPQVIATKGATAVFGVLHWREPPEVVTVGSTAIRPMLGSPDPTDGSD